MTAAQAALRAGWRPPGGSAGLNSQPGQPRPSSRSPSRRGTWDQPGPRQPVNEATGAAEPDPGRVLGRLPSRARSTVELLAAPQGLQDGDQQGRLSRDPPQHPPWDCTGAHSPPRRRTGGSRASQEGSPARR